MKIKVYNCEEQVVGILYFSSRGWENVRIFKGGEGLKDAFNLYKLKHPIPQRCSEYHETNDIKSFSSYFRQVSFGDKRYLGALDSEIRNFGEFMLYWDKETHEKLQKEYEKLTEFVMKKAA